MQTSLLYPGESLQYEAALRATSPCDLWQLHRLAQRVILHMILMGEGVSQRTQLAALTARLEEDCGAHFMGQMARAYTFFLALEQPVEADAALRRAQELVVPGHPWEMLVPRRLVAEPAPVEPKLVEEEHGRVYAVEGDGVATYLIRLSDGSLVLINPVALSESLTSQIRRLGPIAHIIAPAKYHSDYVMEARRAFPDAKAWGVPGHRGYTRVSGVAFDGYLDDAAPLFPGEIDQVTLRGNDIGDVWLVDRASRTLVTTDALAFSRRPSAWSFLDFYMWAFGVWGRNAMMSHRPIHWRDLRSFQTSLRAAMALDFDRVASCHDSWRAIPDDGKACVHEAVDWILKLTRLDGMRIMSDLIRRHPRWAFQTWRSF